MKQKKNIEVRVMCLNEITFIVIIKLLQSNKEGTLLLFSVWVLFSILISLTLDPAGIYFQESKTSHSFLSHFPYVFSNSQSCL